MARKKASPEPVVTCPSCGREAEPAGGPVNFCPWCGVDVRVPPDASGSFLRRVVADRYRLLALLGEGGMGAVYKAEHIRMGKALALKILRSEFARDTGAAERFLAEARIVSRLSHPHTIAVFDFGEIDGAGSGLYLAMEYVPGKDLASLLLESGPLPEDRVAAIGQQILGSLAEAHEAGIVHRDVKPGNVMLARMRAGEDFVKVLDFGVAKLRDGGPDAGPDAAAAVRSAAGAIVGTPSYLSPEQARGGLLDARSDLYAVGCLLHELASGRPPFVAPSPLAVVAAHLHQEAPRLANVSRPFAEVVHRALRKRPEDRFATADAMREALAAASTGHAPPRARAPEVSRGLRVARREDFSKLETGTRSIRPRLAPVAAVLLAAAVVAVAAWRWADLHALVAGP